MKINKNFVLREVAGNWVALPIGVSMADFSGMLTLNESGAFLWRCLEEHADEKMLVDALCREYFVDRLQARADVEEFLGILESAGCLET